MKNDAPNFNPAGAAELVQRLVQTAKDVIPESISQDVRDNLRAAIQDVISDLDVVTRDELETQKAVLAKTRVKVDEMEKLIAELEKKFD